MDYIDLIPDGNSIDSAVSSAFIIGRNFHHTAAETMQRLCFCIHSAQLRDVQSKTDIILNAGRKGLDVATGVGEPSQSLHFLVHAYIGIITEGSSNSPTS